jgi:RimJ/RimL family protein N-acetyltransferase
MCLQAGGQLIGYVGLGNGESCDLGYCVKKEYWHRGIATEASTAVLERIGRAGYSYVTATHDVNNPRSGDVMKRLGMVYRYSYVEHWQPKDIPVTFRLYQLNLDGDRNRTYLGYWNDSEEHFIEPI